jgi:hypothetical protein
MKLNKLNTTYEKFLKKFSNKGYNFIFFNELDLSKNNQLILRHDIDLNCESALHIAYIESSLNIKSTYFFLLTNNSYNLISDTNSKIVKKIQSLGHKVSLHYDPLLYNILGLKNEIKVFQNIFGPIDIISLHRPQLDNQLSEINFPTTYDDNFFEKISYFADSGGEFRFGNPCDSLDFKEGKNMQLLLHPIWWVSSNIERVKIVNKTLKEKNKALKEHFKNSLKFYEG